MEKKPLMKEKVANELKAYVERMQSSTEVKISSERELSQYFNVSRITLRAAIKELVGDGILIQIKGKGTYITPKNTSTTLHLMCSPQIKNTDPFYLDFLSALTNTALRQSVNINIVNPLQLDQTSADTPLVIIGLLEDGSLLEKLIASYRTIIAIQDYSNYNDVITQIYYNDYKIGWEAAKLLVQYGHTNTLLLAGPEKYPSSLQRKQGYLDAMNSFGMVPLVHTEKMNWAGGYKSGEFLLKELPEQERPTAVFATNDWMAIGFMQNLKENGMQIPKDISIIGCDDIPLADEIIPALTTFQLDVRNLVNELFSLLSNLPMNNTEASRKIILPANLIIRDSLGKVVS